MSLEALFALVLPLLYTLVVRHVTVVAAGGREGYRGAY